MFYNPHKKITVVFLIFVSILFVLTFIFLITRETKMIIIVKPRLEKTSLEETIKIPSDLKAQFLTVNLEEEKNFSPQGSTEVETRARGKVEIINNSNRNQTLVKTTRLLSPEGILFRLEEQVLVPAKGKIEARVYADKPGKESEIGPTHFTIPGLSPSLQKLIYGESKEKMEGGIEKIGLITEKDIDEAKKEIEETINKNMETEIQKRIEKLGINLTEWKIILGEKKLEINSEAKAGEERGEFIVKGKMSVLLIAFKESDLLELVKKIVEKDIPSDRKLKYIDKESLKYDLKSLNILDETADLEIKVKIDTIIKENSSIFDFEKIKKLNKNDIKNYLEQYKEIEEVKIKFNPFWRTKTPQKNELIKIIIKE